jgi:hypothetical protein
VKIARNAIFDRRKADVAHATNIPGQKVSQGSHSAFVPAPLPPKLNWTPRLIGALSVEYARIVKRVGDAKRDRVCCATALLDILEEPAHLKPAENK